MQKPSQSWPCAERWSRFIQVKITSESPFLSWPLQLWNLIGSPVAITPFIYRIELACLFLLFLLFVPLFVVLQMKLLVRSTEWSSRAIQLSRIIAFEGPTESILPRWKSNVMVPYKPASDPWFLTVQGIINRRTLLFFLGYKHFYKAIFKHIWSFATHTNREKCSMYSQNRKMYGQ